MTKKIIAIWAQDEKGVIGKENRLPWHLPAELQHFKETTLNHAIPVSYTHLTLPTNREV